LTPPEQRYYIITKPIIGGDIVPKSTKEIMARERWAAEESFCKGNVDALDEVFAKDIVVRAPPFPDTLGLEAYKKSIPATRQAFPVIRVEWEEVICEGDTAVQRYTWRMKHTGTSASIPVPPTGKEIALKGCTVYHLKNGKVVEFLGYDDMLGMFMQLGMVPPMG
jgi:predicted ester cyclase